MPEAELRELREMIAVARLRFRARVIDVLKTATQDADSLALAIGEVSEHQAYDAWVRNLMMAIGEKGADLNA